MNMTGKQFPERGTLVLGDALMLRPRRRSDGMLARTFGASLDRQLAAGRAPEAASLLAERARQIVSLRRRKAVADNWSHLLTVAADQRRRRAVNVRDDQIRASEPVIRELVRRLAVPLPVKAQGVAMASELLTDAAGPVYNPHSDVTLAAALEAAIDQLDPALPLGA